MNRMTLLDRDSWGRTVKRIYLISLAVLLPGLRPSLPGNTTFFDFLGLMAIGVMLIAFLLGKRVELRLVVPAAIILLGSMLSMLNSEALAMNLTLIGKEIFLFLLFLALYNLIRTEEDVHFFVGAWMLTAVCVSLWILSEIATNFPLRATGSFRNPNMASSYLGISVFLCFESLWWRRRMLAIAYAVLVGSAMLVGTKSLSATGSLMLSLGVVFGGYWLAGGSGNRARFALGTVLVLVVAALVLPQIITLPHFLDRLPGSFEERFLMWMVGVEMFLENPLALEVGPGAFIEVGSVAGRRVTLHSDYLSFLVERGAIALAGLFILLLAIATLSYRSLRRARTVEQLTWVLGLSGMFIFSVIDAFSHEVSHYRHICVMASLIAVQWRLMSGQPMEAADDEPTDLPATALGDQHGTPEGAPALGKS
ncbi:MAG TPA: O-antigen ligase family protein [Vicinamibacteria bacterium]|nr:O-antigen ligase family protein [Vicinamibacteria bacterium]